MQNPHGIEARPWGLFEVLDAKPGWCVKRIEVRPGERLSLQRHALREEQWVVVQGVASVQLDSRSFMLAPGEAIEIPLRSWHRLANHGDGPLVLIEVQTGVECRESDIERAEDDYGRRSP